MERKRLDYILLLVFAILAYISIAVVDKISPPDQSSEISNMVRSWAVVAWYIFLYRVVANFYSNRIIRWSYVFLLVFHFSITVYVHQPNRGAVSDIAGLALISYGSSLLGFGIVFYNILKDVFTRRHDLIYSLLGASNIYFMIPLMFGYLYAFMSVYDPGLVHADPMDVRTILFNSYNYSWFIIAGIDYTAGKIGDVIQSVAVLEAIAGNLFIVFIIGRLMNRME